MKRHLWIILFIFTVFSFPLFLSGFGPSGRVSSGRESLAVSSRRQIQRNFPYGQLPLVFEPNQGQTDPSVKFLARGSGYTLFVTSQEAVLSLKKSRAQLSPQSGKGLGSKPSFFPAPDPSPRTVLRLKLEGAQTNPASEGLEPLAGISNYFIGKDPAQWHRNIPQYSKVATRGLYPGVDMVYYGNQGKLEYDFVVQPGTDPASIRMRIEGAQKVQVNDQGDMELTTAEGKVVFQAPSVYQGEAGEKNELKGRYKLDEENRVGFEVRDYDRSKPLVIDPVLDYSTYLGGSNFDRAAGIAVDSGGNAYVTGWAESADFPTTAGAFQTVLGGSQNAFVAKLNPTGTGLIYSTYVGGNNSDGGAAIVLDAAGNAYVAGGTSSTNFPATAGAFQTVFGTTVGSNAMVFKLNAAGNNLIYSTYLGVTDDWASGIGIDPSGNAYVAGTTYSRGFPITAGAFQTTFSGIFDAFVTELNPTGSGLVYSTFLGGNSGQEAFALSVDANGFAYVTGDTGSPNFPTSPGAFQTVYLSANANVFVTKMNQTGSGLSYSTYLGGTGNDYGHAITFDSGGNAYVTGLTSSTDFPITAGAYQTTLNGSTGDTFVTKLNPTGTGLVYSTYMGGSGYDYGAGIALDSSGQAYITGQTFSTGFPTTAGAYQTVYGGAGEDAYLTIFNPAGSALVYSTFLGGNSYDWGQAIALDSGGGVYVAGYTNSSNFPTTTGAYQTTLAGDDDAFVTKFDITTFNTPTPTPSATNSPTPTSTGVLTATRTPSASPTFTPTVTPTGTINLATPTPGSCDLFYVSKNIIQHGSEPVSIHVVYCEYPGNYFLGVYNSAGELVKTLDSPYLQGPLNKTYTWNGTNRDGDPCASGVYIFYLIEPFDRKVKRILLIR